MTRGTLVLASSLAAAAVSGALVYGLRSPPPSSPAEAGQSPTETAQPQAESPAEMPQDVSAGAPQEATATLDGQSPTELFDERGARRGAPLDEGTQRERDTQEALREVLIGYTLLFEDLDLPEQDKKDLIALLVDMQLERAWTSYQDGRTISAEERSDRISAVIGQQKLEQFLALEKNGREYWEAYQIALLLQRRGVPTTPAQRDAVFDILIEVHERYPFTELAELDYRSEEYIDELLRQLDDTDRHIVELVPSVLSPTQVAYLSRAYDHMSRERIDDVEWQKNRKVDHHGEDVGWMTPGRWSWRSFEP